MKSRIFIWIGIFVLILLPLRAEKSKIRVAIDEFYPFCSVVETGNYKGFDIDLMEKIAEKNQWEIIWVLKKNVSEILSSVENNEADIAISGITITSEREKALDFSHGYFESGLQILINQSHSGNFDIVKGLKSAFPVIMKNILALLIFLTITAHVMWLIERNNQSEEHFSESYLNGVGQGYWWSIVTMTTVGYGDIVPKLKNGRILAGFIMISGIMWFSVFTASLGAAITTNFFSSEISGLSDLEGKIVGTKNGSIAYETMKNIAGIKIVVYDDIKKACQDTASGVTVATVFDMPGLAVYAKKDQRVALAGKLFQNQQYGIAMKSGSSLREKINHALLELKESNDYDKLYRKWFGQRGE